MIQHEQLKCNEVGDYLSVHVDNTELTMNTVSKNCCYILGNKMYRVDHVTVVCLVAWLLNENEAGSDLILTETYLLFLCKFLLISMRTASVTLEKQGVFHQNKVTSSLTFIQRTGNYTEGNHKMVYDSFQAN